MKHPKDGDMIDFSKKVEILAPIKDTRWRPVEGNTKVGVYGAGTPTPSPSLEEMAKLDVKQYYPYLLEGTPEYHRRLREQLAKLTT